MAKYGKLLSFSRERQGVVLQFENGTGMVSAITDRIIRIQDVTETPSVPSKAIEGDKLRETYFDIREQEEGLCFSTDQVSVMIYDGFMTDIYDHGGKALCRDYRGERKLLKNIDPAMLDFMAKEGHQFQGDGKEHKVQVVKTIEGGECFYGLGDKTGFLNKRGYEYTMWNTDNPAPHVDSFQSLYKSIPFFITLRDDAVYGIFFDNTNRTYFDMGKESDRYFWFGSDRGTLDYYFIAGDDMKEVVSGYAYLTGTAPLPQMWTLGYHQSRWGYNTTGDIRKIASDMKRYDIPCDAIHLDIEYMDQYKVFTVNKERIPDMKGLTEELGEQGIKLVTIIDPGVKKEQGYSVYEDGMKKDCFAKSPDGSVYENTVWAGVSVYPDFGRENVRKWWGENHKALLDAGVRGIWTDMNEPAGFEGELPQDVVFYDEERKTDHAEMHNVYGHNMAKATYEALKALDQKRPFVITRACYSGSQKYTTAWTGDNHSIWAHLQMAVTQICNLGLSGMPVTGSDIGGFGSDTTAELLSRWIETGCFSPFCRNHASMGTREQEPWQFDERTLNIYRKYLKLRYRLIPYYYDLFYEEEKTGIPVMRPLVLNYPEDRKVRECNGEFMIGDQILVAPVLEQGAREKLVYLPEGKWYDYWTGEEIDGGVSFVRTAELDTCPVYIKAGSIIPGFTECNSLDLRDRNTLFLDIYPGDGEYIHYQDDGESFDYRDGKYNKYRFSVKGGTLTGELVHHGYEPVYERFPVNFHGGGDDPGTGKAARAEKENTSGGAGQVRGEVKTIQYEVRQDEKDGETMEGLLFHM